jgi:hypothetical protein
LASRRRRSAPTIHGGRDVPKRELITVGSTQRYIRRDERGRFTADQTGVGRSLTADRRTQAKTVAPKGQGDRGDRRR